MLVFILIKICIIIVFKSALKIHLILYFTIRIPEYNIKIS